PLQIARDNSVDRQRVSLRYVKELPEAHAQNGVLFDHGQDTAPDLRSGIVVWIHLTAIGKFPDEEWAEYRGNQQNQQADGEPYLACNPVSRANPRNDENRSSRQCCAPRCSLENTEQYQGSRASGNDPPCRI